MIKSELEDRTPILDAANSLLGWWDSERDMLEYRLDAPLFHYTNAAGLRGIVEGGKLWFTSIFHLNDPSEFTHGLDLALRELQEHENVTEGDLGPVIRRFCRALDGTLRKPLPYGFYVASFSADPDELGQWRAYGDDGRGFAIGFSGDVFRAGKGGAATPIDALVAGQVIYDSTAASAGHRAAIQQATKIIAEYRERNTSVSAEELIELLQAMSVALSVPIIWSAATTKNMAYRGEQETRLLIINQAEKLARFVDTRIRGSELVPYIQYPLNFGPTRGIAEIVIGPAADDRAEDAVAALLARHDIGKKIAIRRSTIPYRSVR